MAKDEKNTSVEVKYLNEKKKSTVLLASTVALAILFVGAVFIRLPRIGVLAKEAPIGNRIVERERENENERGFIMDQRQPQGMMRGGQGVDSFFNEDGSLNSDAVDNFNELKDADPEDRPLIMLKNRIEKEVEDGKITSDQGKELESALELD